MNHSVSTTNGTPTALPTVLGQRAIRICTGGKIRAGIKVLTRAAANHPRAKAIYDQGVTLNKSFEQIEREIAEALPELKAPLVPKNVPWFSVRPDDFPNPQIAHQILESFGEDRGDGVRRLYRIPVVFPADQWQSVMPHELVAWGANERKFWSEYSPDGRVRHCKCYAPVPKDSTGKRAIRVFGGRKTMLRSENAGQCEPEACREYQMRQCNLSGRLLFYIPGIPSIDAFELATNSFYAMNAAIQKFETIAFLRGGRLSGFLDGRRTPFYLTKKLTEVPHIDEEGRAVRVKQWIIELEAPVDVTALLRANEEEATLIARADHAARILEGMAAVGAADDEALAGEAGAAALEGERQALSAEDTAVGAQEDSCVPALATQDVRPALAPQVPSPPPRAGAQGNGATGPSLDEVAALLNEIGVDPARYAQYATKRWGSGWKLNAGGRRRAQEQIGSFRGDPAGLTAKIDAELDTFA